MRLKSVDGALRFSCEMNRRGGGCAGGGEGAGPVPLFHFKWKGTSNMEGF